MIVRKIVKWTPPESLRRAVHIETSAYLHLGGVSNTTDKDYRWRGTRAQFESLDIIHDDYRLEMPEGSPVGGSL